MPNFRVVVGRNGRHVDERIVNAIFPSDLENWAAGFARDYIQKRIVDEAQRKRKRFPKVMAGFFTLQRVTTGFEPSTAILWREGRRKVTVGDLLFSPKDMVPAEWRAAAEKTASLLAVQFDVYPGFMRGAAGLAPKFEGQLIQLQFDVFRTYEAIS